MDSDLIITDLTVTNIVDKILDQSNGGEYITEEVGGHTWVVSVDYCFGRDNDLVVLVSVREGEPVTARVTVGVVNTSLESSWTGTFCSRSSSIILLRIGHDDIFSNVDDGTFSDGTLSIRVAIQKKVEVRHTYLCPKLHFLRMLAALESIDHADIAFDFQNEIITAHRLVLEVHAPMLAKLCEGFSLESPVPISETSPQITSEVFRHLLRFVYARVLPDEETLSEDVRAFIDAADRFGAIELKMILEHFVIEQGIINVTNVLDFILLGDEKNCALIKESSLCFFYQHMDKVFLSDEWSNTMATVAPDNLAKEIILYTRDRFTRRGKSSVRWMRQSLYDNRVDFDGSREMLASRCHEIGLGTRDRFGFGSVTTYDDGPVFRQFQINDVARKIRESVDESNDQTETETDVHIVGEPRPLKYLVVYNHELQGSLSIFIRTTTEPFNARITVSVSALSIERSGVYYLPESGHGDGARVLDIEHAAILDAADALEDGSLSINVEVLKKIDIEASYLSSKLYFDCMRDLLNDDEKADVAFKVDDEVITAHKMILSIHHVPELYSLCIGHSVDAPVHITDLTPLVFRSILGFIYARDIPDKDALEEEGKSLIDAAIRFGVTELKLAIENALLEHDLIDLSNVLDYLKYADEMKCSLLKEYCVNHIIFNYLELSGNGEWDSFRSTNAHLAKEVRRYARKKGNGIHEKSVFELRQELFGFGLVLDGSKNELNTRLREYVADQSQVGALDLEG